MNIAQLAVRNNDNKTDSCQTGNNYNGHNELRILAVFMMLISSGLGAFFPLFASSYSIIRLPDWCFFIAKFFGSGVIIATAFIHLLYPASEALGNDCLGDTFVDYPFAFAICLISLFLLFFTEIVSHYFIARKIGNDSYSERSDEDQAPSDFSIAVRDNNSAHYAGEQVDANSKLPFYQNEKSSRSDNQCLKDVQVKEEIQKNVEITGFNNYSHSKNDCELRQPHTLEQKIKKEQYLNQILAVSVLEMGVVFHSIFVGLSLAVSGEEFKTLLIVLIFHQMFEGLGLGTRLAETKWPTGRKYTPWLMALGFTLATPIAIAIGIGVRSSWVPESRKALIANGVFDSISSGILIYTGLIELMAREFLYSKQFKGPSTFKRMLSAYMMMCCGAALMAVLGKWA